jgi:hypothetical protein
MRKLLLILFLALPLNAIAEEQCSVIVGDVATGNYRVVTGQCFDTEAQALKLGYVNPALLRSGCCSKHKGVASCDSSRRKYRCKDGTISPTCTCTPPKKPTNSCKR